MGAGSVAGAMGRIAVGAVVVSSSLLWAAVAGAQTSASCSTFNEANEPTSTFDAGAPIVVRGTGFGSRSLVFVRFEQGSRTAELARAQANDLGAFTIADSRLPDALDDGGASILALDARASADCRITVRTATADDSDGLGVVYLVWGFALAAFAVLLGVFTYRRWKSERLSAAMDRVSRRGPRPDDVEGELVREDPHEGFEPPRGPAPDDEEKDMEPDEEPADEPVTEADVAEPPRLPVGWDSGRLRPNRQASEAIERLRREVRTWGRS